MRQPAIQLKLQQEKVEKKTSKKQQAKEKGPAAWSKPQDKYAHEGKKRVLNTGDVKA